MSYCRWGSKGCDGKASRDWYIFASADGRGSTLAVWHCTSRTLPHFTTSEVREMVETGDPSRVEGFKEGYRDELVRYMRYYLQDEEVDGKARGGTDETRQG